MKIKATSWEYDQFNNRIRFYSDDNEEVHAIDLEELADNEMERFNKIKWK